jgi:hypothetical protein
MFCLYLLPSALLWSVQVDCIPKPRELCLCQKSLCIFFCEKAIPFFSSQGMFSSFPGTTPLRHMYVYCGRKGFPIRISELRADGYMLHAPPTSHQRKIPLDKSATVSRSHCRNSGNENAVLLLTNLGSLLLLTIRPRQHTATDNQTSATYCYWQSNLRSLLLLTIKPRQPTATDDQTSETYCYGQSNIGTLLLLTIKPREPTATDDQSSAAYCYWQSNLDFEVSVLSLPEKSLVHIKYHLMTMIMMVLNIHLSDLVCMCLYYVWVCVFYVVCAYVCAYAFLLCVPEI